MLRVKDENGNIIQGLYKDPMGSIVVEKNSDYERYLREKQQQEAINNLKQEFSELKAIIQNLIGAINKDSTEGQ